MKHLLTLFWLFCRDVRLIGVRYAFDLLKERHFFNSLSADEKVAFIEGH